MLNRGFTFRSRTTAGAALPRFAAVVLISYSAAYYTGLSIAAVTAEWVGLSGSAAEDAAIVIGMTLYTGMNYAGQKLLVFRNQ